MIFVRLRHMHLNAAVLKLKNLRMQKHSILSAPCFRHWMVAWSWFTDSALPKMWFVPCPCPALVAGMGSSGAVSLGLRTGLALGR